MNALRMRRRKIVAAYVGIWVVPTFLWPGFVFPALLILIPRFRLWLYRFFIGQATCPTCGATIPLVGSWRCGGCGFVQHRHAYKPCAKCGVGIGEIPCPY